MADRRNAAIAGLAALVVVLGVLLLVQAREPAGGGARAPESGEPVSVVDLDVDHEHLRHLDLILSRPVGEGRVGDALARDPAALAPRTGGTWRFVAANVLRFEPSARLAPATRYVVTVRPAQLLQPGQVWSGDERLEAQTDAFRVERIDVAEEPAPGDAQVRLRGQILFNYEVEPEELVRKLQVVDPAREQPLPVELETRWRSNVVAWRSAPVQKGSREREIRVSVLSDLTAAEGNVPLAGDVEQVHRLGSRTRLQLRDLRATSGERESTVELDFSSAVEAGTARSYVELAPAAAAHFAASGNTLRISGPWAPGTALVLRLRAGLPAGDGATLQEEVERRLRLPDLAPSVAFQGQGMFLSSAGRRELAIASVNVARVELAVDRVYRNNVLYLLQQQGGSVVSDRSWGDVAHVFGDRVAEETLELGSERNRRSVTRVGLAPWIDPEAPGFYRVAVRQPGEYAWTQRWVLVTGLGLVAKVGGEDLLVLAARVADASPVPGVDVRVISDQNQEIARGRTGADGLLHLRDLGEAFSRQRPAWLVASRGDDWTFLDLDRTRVDTGGLDVAGAAAPKTGFDAYLYGPRTLFRPGETVEGVALLRDASLAPPTPMPVLLRHRDPQGRIGRSLPLTLDAAGSAAFRFAIPEGAPTGGHRLELLVGEDVAGSFDYQVEEFVPDRIRAELTPPARAPGPGETLVTALRASWLFGPPAGGLPVSWSVRLAPRSFRPDGYAAFTFANDEREFRARELLTREGALDAEGRLQLEAPLPAGLQVPSALSAVVTARVREPGGRGVATWRAVPVDPVDAYLGLRREGEGTLAPGAEARFRFVSVAPDGGLRPAGRVRAELYRDEWNTVLRRTSSGSYRWDSAREPRLVEERELPAGASEGALAFSPGRTGSFRLVLTDLDHGGSTQVRFFVSDWDWAPWAVEHPDRLEIDVEGDDHAPGSRAVVNVRAPFGGRLLLTVERDRVLYTELHPMPGNSARLSVPLPEEARPNVYVTATVLRGADQLEPGGVARAFGAVPVQVDRLRHHMRVRVEAPEEMRPESPLLVTAHAAPGARITVAAVDEGVLQLAGRPDPDPFGHFYRQRALGVSSHDAFGLLLPELEARAAVGGGESLAKRAGMLRTEGILRLKPVALWSGVLEADAEGRATARFQVPAFQGALRVVAVAHAGADFGAAAAETRVRDELVLLPTAPRFLAPGDETELLVTVRNDTGGAVDVALTATLEGAAAPTGEALRHLQLADGGQQLVAFPLQAGEDGEIRYTLEASAGDERTHAEGSLGVRPDLPQVRVASAGALGEGRTRLASPPDPGLRSEGRERRLRVAATPLVQLAEPLATLLRYPYGCLEQTVSRVFPLLRVGALALALERDLLAKADPDALVAAGIDRAGSFARPDGGFSLWPGGDEVSPWTSLYTAHFLVEAERAGHAVPGPLMDGALAYAAREAASRPQPTHPELERTVYALYVLARAGRAEPGSMDFVRERLAGDLSPSSRVLLAAAYAATGRADALPELLGAVADAEQVRRDTGGNFASTTRDRALLLLGLLDAAPGDPRIPALAERLARDARTGGWNTQESAFALLAVGQWLAGFSAAPLHGRVLLDGRELVRFDATPFESGPLPVEGALEVELEGTGGARGWYALTLRGTPRDDTWQPVQEGVQLERSFLDRSGQTIGLDGLAQGDLVVARIRSRSLAGRLDNVVIQQLLPAGLEVENPRLASSEALPWVTDAAPHADHVDVRDDRVLLFTSYPSQEWRTDYVLLRAVSPGRFRLPPVQAEAMYEPGIRSASDRGSLEVRRP